MATIPNLNPSPKQRFVGVEANVKAHMALIERDDLDRSLDAALRQYQLLLAFESKDANTAAAAQFKMNGVLEFLHQFKYLAVLGAPARSEKTAQLDYSAQ